MSEELNYFINNPVFVRYKRRFDFRRMCSLPRLKSLNINERVAEIPFALECLLSRGIKGRVLDVGCMESLLPFYAAALGFQVTGVDLREFPYKFPHFEFRKADILALPFSDGEFDAVTCISTVEHIGINFYDGSNRLEEGDVKAVAQLHRVLKPGGLLVLTVPFGVRAVTAQQRIYDYPQLQHLLKSFILEDVKFFRDGRSEGARNNFWQEVGREEALRTSANIPSMVCLIKAQKCA